MYARYRYASVTRGSDIRKVPFEVGPLPRSEWATGDFVVGEVQGTPYYPTELDSGRMILTMDGDLLIGSLGKREATLEGVGDWEEIGADGHMHVLTGAGLLGKATSISPLLPEWPVLQYRGHLFRDAGKLNMMDFSVRPEPRGLDVPIVLIVGTSMSAGKTTTGRTVINELCRLGYRLGGAKLSGASRYRDILSFRDAGAVHISDFVDVGLPSTVCPVEEYREAMVRLLSHIAGANIDVLVVEAGASPLEPYNGATAVEMIHDLVRCTVLCASDPYAVVGVQAAFDLRPDLVAGPASITDAAIELVHKLTGLRALNLLDRNTLPVLREILLSRLGLEPPH